MDHSLQLITLSLNSCVMKCIFMAGWWYGVVGHLELCNGNENYCRCHSSGELMNFPFKLMCFIISYNFVAVDFTFYHSFNQCSVPQFKLNYFLSKIEQ